MKFLNRFFKRKQKIMDSPGRPKIKLDINKILELKSQGISINKIGKILGVSEGTVRNRLKNSANIEK